MTDAAWDTNLVSRVLRGFTRHVQMLTSALDDPVVTTAISVSEVAYGLSRRADVPAWDALAEFTGYIDEGLIRVLVFDATAAALFGKLRAVAPEPPRAARGDRRTTAERRMAWRLDMMIAATACAHGFGVRTADTHHFAAIADAMNHHILGAGDPPLEIHPA